MKTSAKQWGNSIGIRIPQPFAKEIGITNGTQLEVKILNNKLILSKPKLTLDKLLEQIDTENIHEEIDTGLPKGKEIW